MLQIVLINLAGEHNEPWDLDTPKNLCFDLFGNFGLEHGGPIAPADLYDTTATQSPVGKHRQGYLAYKKHCVKQSCT